MKDARIRVKVKPGRAAAERFVLTVSERDLDSDLLRIEVIGEDAERFTVRRPSPTLSGAITAMLLRADVLPAGGAS
jgi:hypothetical protein